MGKPFTESERDYLRQHFANTTNRDLAKQMGRDHNVISKIAQSLGLVKDAAYMSALRSKAVRDRSPWSNEHLEILDLMYPHCGSQVIADLFGFAKDSVNEMAARRGLKKTKETLAAMQYERLAKNPEAYAAVRIKPGSVPWNKGRKGITQGGIATQFKKGNTPSTTLPIGTERWKLTRGNRQHQPYLVRKVAEPNVWKPVHYLVWEAANGPVPDGCVLRFKDKDHRNITTDNLECLTRAENSRRNTVWATMPREMADLCVLQGMLKRQIRKAQEKQA